MNIRSSKRRMLSLFLVILLLSNILATTAYATLGGIVPPRDGATLFTIDGFSHVGLPGSNAMNSGTVGVRDAINIYSDNWITQAFGTGDDSIDGLYQQFSAALQSENTTEKGVNELLTYYGKMLVYLNWTTRNFWTDVDGTQKYSITTIPMSVDGTATAMEVSKYKTYLNNLNEMYDTFMNGDTFPSETTWINDTVPIYVPDNNKETIFGSRFDVDSNSENIVSNSGALVNNTYIDALHSLFTQYIDASILYAIAKGEAEEQGWTGWEDWSYETLLEVVGNADGESVPEFWKNYSQAGTTATTPITPGTPDIPANPADPSNPANPDDPANPTNPEDPANPTTPEDVILGNDTLTRLGPNLLAKYEKEITPFLTLYHSIYELYLNRNGVAFADIAKASTDGTTQEVQYIGWTRNVSDTVNQDDYPNTWMSDLFYYLYNAKVFTNSDAVDPGVNNGNVNNVDTSKGIFGMLVRDGVINDGAITVNGDAELTDIGYIILAAGATYDPFVSYAGNEAWLATVLRFVSGEEEKEQISKILQVALNTKKPLYVTDGKKSAWVTEDSVPSMSSADYRYAFLQDALQAEEDITRAYIVVKGSMAPSVVDGSTWEYANKDPSINQNNTSSSVHVESSDQANTVATDNTNQVQGDATVNAVSEYLMTTAAGQLFAADYQVTTPVMFTSGFKSKWWGSEAVGYSAAVGGTTSIILENARLDAKDNQHIQNARTEQLFLNGLGDIVLQDGTIILPAISNPCLYEYTAPTGESSLEGAAGNPGADEDTDEDTDTSESDETMLDSIRGSTDFYAYYPYTASLMNHYPTARVTADGKLAVDSSNDTNKYLMIFQQEDTKLSWNLSTVYAKKIEKVTQGTGQASLAQLGSLRAAPFMANSFRVEDDEASSFSIVSIAYGDAGTTWQNWLSSGFQLFTTVTGGTMGGGWGMVGGGAVGDAVTGNMDGAYERSHMYFITKGQAYNEDGMPFFPLHDDSTETRDDFLKLAGPITTSALRYISDNDVSTGAKVSSGYFKIEDYIYEFVGQGLLGTQYTATLVKNSQVSYDQLVEDQSGRFLKFLIQIVDTACESLGKIDGVLSIKGPYENMFFNTIFTFIQDFYLLIAVVLLVVTAAKFFKGHFNMLYVCFVACLCVAGFEVYANWLPTLVPQVYNFAVNDTIENIVWNTTFYNAESYKDTYRNADNVDPISGKSQPYTGTITLYQLTNAEMREVAARTGVSVETLRKGSVVYLDSDAGIYVQGNLIKMSIDKLLVNNSMRGLYKSQWDTLGPEYMGTDDLLIENIPAYNGNPYSIQLIQPLVSLEAYYTPYDHFERALLSQLNQFANYFMIERRMYTYDQGELYKDAFMTSAYVNSGIFTAPGDIEVLRNSVQLDTITAKVSNLSDAFVSYDVNDLLQDIQEAFTPEEDWLGIVKVFAEPDVGIQNSLWGYLMQNRGWYDRSWQMTTYGDEKLSDMVRYINNQTKLWVINNLDNLDSMSDENAIKMISLYATTCFTHYFSEIGKWVYPNYINAADIELKDVLYGSMVTLRDKNFAYDGTVVNTVGINLGIFGVIFLLFIILFSALFIFVVTYMVPVLYGALGCIVVFKLVNSDDKIGVVKGYTKVTLVSAVLYFLFSLSLQLVSVGGYKWYSYMMCAICLFFCNYFLFWVVLSVVTDFGELGNNTLARNMIRSVDNLTRGTFSRLSTNVANITNRNRTTIAPRVAYQYGRGYSVDDYDRPRGRRSSLSSVPDDYSRPGGVPGHRPQGYGRQDYYEDTIGPSRGSRANRTTRSRRGWRSSVNR